MYDEILQAVIHMAEDAANTHIVTGSMPPDNGIAMIGQSASAPIFLDIGSNETMNVVCNGKNVSLQTIINQLDAIHRYLTRRKNYPHSNEWQIYAIETVSSPRLLGREQNSQWLYGSTLIVRINVKGIS